MSMDLVYRSSVNRWECDENDHMNVRFFVQKHWETLCSGYPEVSADQMFNTVSNLHLRYLREAPLSTPISGYVLTVYLPSSEVRYLTELRHSFTDEVLSTCLHGVSTPLESDVGVPVYAAPRGVADANSAFIHADPSQLKARGFSLIGKGRITEAECARTGTLLPQGYMGRLSDSMPHLWGTIYDGMLGEDEGGAVLEYRLDLLSRLTAGDGYQIWSGLTDVAPKVHTFSHVMFDHQGRAMMTAGAVGVRLDLKSRKVRLLSEERVAKMRGKLVK